MRPAYHLVLALLVGAFGAGLALGAGCGGGAGLARTRAELDNAQRDLAGARIRFRSELGRLEASARDAQAAAGRSDQAARKAFGEYRDLRNRVDAYLGSSREITRDLLDGGLGDAELIDRAIADLDRYERSLEVLRGGR